MNYSAYLWLGLFLLQSAGLCAQGEGNIWYFGQQHGLSFASGEPVPITDGALTTTRSSAVLCDADGNLRYYTNGGGRTTPGDPRGSIWNRNHGVMYDMEGLKGGSYAAAQSSLFVPVPGSPGRHYLFTMEERDFGTDGLPPGQQQGRGLSYFIIDGALNGGLGGVVQADERLHVPSFESLSGTLHNDGEQYWIAIVDRNTEDFFTYRIAANGSIDGPTLRPRGTSEPLRGPIKFSPAGNRLFVGGVLYGFNKGTGIISAPTVLPGALNSRSYSFSPDSRFLYVLEPSVSAQLLVRYEVAAASIFASRTILASLPGIEPGQMQLAPDGRIYLLTFRPAVPGQVTLNAIECPNSAQAILTQGVLNFPISGEPFFGLPNFMDHIFQGDFAPSVDVGEDRTLDCGNGPIVLMPTAQGGDLLWSTGDTTLNLTVNEAGTYILTVSFACGIVADTIVVDEISDSLIVNIDGPGEICPGSSLTLTASANLEGTWSWSTGDTLSSINISSGGVYVAAFADRCGRTAQDSFTVAALDLPEISLQLPEALCPDEPGRAVAVSAGALGYEWSNGARGDTASLSGGGDYALTVTNVCGEADTAFSITELPLPTLSLSGAAALCPGSELEIEAITEPGNSILWSTGAQQAALRASQPGTYTATASNDCGSVSDSLDLQPIGCDNCFYIPNAFSPNDDGRNDTFVPIPLCPVAAYRLQVFSRWGEQVFDSATLSEGWTGTYRGQPAPIGLYTWLLTYEQVGEPQQQSGELLLLR